MISWVTESEAKEAAKTRKGAIACSFKKWEQLCRATQVELAILKRDEPPCALCYRYRWKQQQCPLVGRLCDDPFPSCCGHWQDAHAALIDWSCDKTLANFRKWRTAARAMRDRIKAIK